MDIAKNNIVSVERIYQKAKIRRCSLVGLSTTDESVSRSRRAVDPLFFLDLCRLSCFSIPKIRNQTEIVMSRGSRKARKTRTQPKMKSSSCTTVNSSPSTMLFSSRLTFPRLFMWYNFQHIPLIWMWSDILAGEGRILWFTVQLKGKKGGGS